jgi:hypothetical protein
MTEVDIILLYKTYCITIIASGGWTVYRARALLAIQDSMSFVGSNMEGRVNL